MKILKQLCIYFGITFISEVISKFLLINIPASIIGIIILFTALELNIIKMDQVETVGEFLIKIMPLLFIPAGVSLINFLPQLEEILVPMLLTTTLSTAIVMVSVGKIIQKYLEGK